MKKDHYYSYLYSFFLKRFRKVSGDDKGYDISERPDVLVTLFNLGFNASVPKADPRCPVLP